MSGDHQSISRFSIAILQFREISRNGKWSSTELTRCCGCWTDRPASVSMFKDVPTQVWLLLAIAVTAYVPTLYVYRHFAHSPSRRDITQPPEDLSWRTSKQLVRSLAIITILAAFGTFIFTPAAVQFAKSPSFLPLLAVAGGGWALVTVAIGFSTGRIEPLVRGLNSVFERDSQPKRFWASMTWNGLLGLGCLWLAFKTNEQATWQPLEDRCYDLKNAYSPKEELSACNQLINARRRDDNIADLVAARGSSYFRNGDYRRAKIDYIHAISLNPNDSSSHYNLALIDQERGDIDGAVVHYSAAIRAHPENADAYYNRGKLMLQGDKTALALADFTRAHELRPKDPWPLAARGIVYVWKKDRARAKQDFAAVRVLDPSNPDMLRGEAKLSMDAGDMKSAVRRLTAALVRAPGDRPLLRMRAEAYRDLGKTEEADEDLDELWRLRMRSNQADR